MKRRWDFRNFTKAAVCFVFLIGTVLPFVSCRKVEEKAKEGAAYLIGMDEYVYGFPLVMMDLSSRGITAVPKAGEYYAPVNQFLRMRTFVDPDYKMVVRISRSSLWSGAILDLKEPVVVTIPDCKDIPVAVRWMNYWTDVFGTAGSRTPDNQFGDYLIVGPGWSGTPPSNVKNVYTSTTRGAWVLLEMAAPHGQQDFPKIHALQDQLKVTPLSAWGKPYTPPATVPVDPTVDRTALPYDQLRLMTGEMFFKRLATLLKDNPSYPADSTMVERLKRIGVEAGKDFDPSKLDPGIRKGINEAPFEVWKKFAAGPFDMDPPNGWVTMLDVARYGTDYQTRAYVAYMGLGAGVKEDIIYPTAFVDGKGWALDCAHKYILHMTKADMAASQNGVWSISQYRENFYVRNSIGRYQIGSGMPLNYNPDGSLDVYIQAASPGKDKEPNWLPTPPSGMFNLSLRFYDPKPETFEPTYMIPPVQRVD
jgi:hypothetical protein